MEIGSTIRDVGVTDGAFSRVSIQRALLVDGKAIVASDNVFVSLGTEVVPGVTEHVYARVFGKVEVCAGSTVTSGTVKMRMGRPSSTARRGVQVINYRQRKMRMRRAAYPGEPLFRLCGPVLECAGCNRWRSALYFPQGSYGWLCRRCHALTRESAECREMRYMLALNRDTRRQVEAWAFEDGWTERRQTARDTLRLGPLNPPRKWRLVAPARGTLMVPTTWSEPVAELPDDFFDPP